MNDEYTSETVNEADIAVIGMACRFPGANDVDQLWRNLCDGVESISFFSDEELREAGVDEATLQNPNYVKARAILDDIETFDAAFFGYSPGEAEMMDPQQRVFLQEAWRAIETAGYHPETYSGAVGVYAGVGMNTYLLKNLYPNLRQLGIAAAYQVMIGNNKDFLSTRVAYKLSLTGPAITVQTACSTSLVATHLACQSLLLGECDMALAGGVSINIPQKSGYVYQEGMISSPDGHCRAFDARAKGTVAGNGVGLVMLKRLVDALEDGDTVHAVIKGSAMNNDGALKVGYTAPSVDGQAAVIAEAQAVAGVEADTVTYIETHGTGTTLGDPIEIRALTQAFQASASGRGFCAIGSVKTNFGHLDAAAGVAGLIKTVLALKHRKLPPSLHFEQPNPQIDFANSPFYVNTALTDWNPNGMPRRAGVSSFGIGGTNVHVVLEEAPSQPPSGASRSEQLLVLSAQTESALETMSANLATYLRQHTGLNFADVAYTLQKGRKPLPQRRALVCSDADEAVKILNALPSKQAPTGYEETTDRPVVFMFPGQGAQYVNMGRDLYQTEPTFREQVDRCAGLLQPLMGLDLREILYPDDARRDEAAQQLQQTSVTQPALFVIEYALAQLWLEWGIRPCALIGHSLGEYTAACVAGVMSLEDALTILTTRARLMQDLPGGAMLSVPLSEAALQPLLTDALSVAVINAPEMCVVSGPYDAVDKLEQDLTAKGVNSVRLHTSHAFHSGMMEPILDEFTRSVQTISLHPPQIPWVSTVTGNWVTADDVTDPGYWARNLRQTVRFGAAIGEILQQASHILLEVGPGRTLSTLAKRQPDSSPEQVALASVRHPRESQSDTGFVLTTLGQLWLAGAAIDWDGFYQREQRRRLPLPTYPFEGERYWIEADEAFQPTAQPSLAKKPDIADWFYAPSWKRRPLPRRSAAEPSTGGWLVFVDECGLGSQLADRLRQQGQPVVTVTPGVKFEQTAAQAFTLNPEHPEEYESLFTELSDLDALPARIVHLWSLTELAYPAGELEPAQQRGFYSLLFLAQAIGRQQKTDALEIHVLSNHLQTVIGDEQLCPAKATILGPVNVIPQEYPHITCRSLDLSLPDGPVADSLVEQVLTELRQAPEEHVAALRGQQRWVQTFEPLRLDAAFDGATRLRDRGVYLITGGLGGIGLVLADYLATTVQARLVLVGRSALPARAEWDQWLREHDEQERTSRKIRHIRQLEEHGAEVLALSADVADLNQMQAVLAETESRFRPVTGVIHAAGVPGGGLMQQKTADAVEDILAPKVKGSLVLYDLFHDHQLDFFVVCSSLSSIFGGFGQVAYSAANAFLDAFAQHPGVPEVICVNWDTWQEIGMAANMTVPAELHDWWQESLQKGIAPAEGKEVFCRILGAGLPQTVISTYDFQARLEAEQESMLSQSSEISTTKTSFKTKYPRPELNTPYVAPRNPTEQKIVDIWQSCLSLEQVGVHDDFFELGGHSLLASELVTQIQQHFGQALPLTALINTPTVAQLAQLLEEQTPADTVFTPLVNIQPQGQKSPFFCVHPVDGNVFYYTELARQLGADRPFYGLQAFGLEPQTTPLSRIKDMAQTYLEYIRHVQPGGMYLIAGFCIGGMIAYEIVQQLHKMGESVPLLVLIDSLAPHLYTPFQDEVEHFLAFARNFEGFGDTDLLPSYCEIRQIDPRNGMEGVRNDLRVLSSEERLQVLFAAARKAGILSEEADVTYLERVFQVYSAHVQAILDYTPRAYSGQTVLFRASDGFGNDRDDQSLGWQRYAASLEVQEVPGDHYTMLTQPHVKVLADKLNMYLDNVT